MSIYLLQVLLFVFFLVVRPLQSLHLQNPQPFRSRKSPSEIINIYEVVIPDISFGSELTHEGHPKEISVVLHSRKESYMLDLFLNENLLSPSFASGYHIKGQKYEEGHQNCFYHGKVRGHGNWSVVLSTCYGLRGWFGDLHDQNNLYHIEPIEETRESLTVPHALYMDSEHQNNKHGSCGTNGIHEIGDFTASQKPHEYHKLKKRQAEETLIVEWLMVNDFRQYVNYGSNISAVAHRAIEIANHVDMLYRALNIRVVLVYSLTWTSGQEIVETVDADTLLNRFQVYHRENTDFEEIVHDSAMLITGIDISGSTVGVAFLNTMCIYDTSVGFTQDTGSSINSVGGIAAHELGHIFNMQHDDAAGCQCPDQNGCIMNAALGFPAPNQFSQCSKNQLAEGLQQGRGICLDNNPTMIFGDPMCGNGIKEPGEVCDCGSLLECRDPCCNATTCTLSEGSECAEGECCNDCQFIEYGTTCRESRGECGIAEYCTGDSAECPRDVYLQNGIDCDNNNSYCYDGNCVSLNAQCELYYGEDANPSVQECYDDYNTMGVAYGHCGAANDVFIPCQAQNVRCGSIQCKDGEIVFRNIDFSSTLTSYTRSTAVEGRFEECSTFSTAASADEISPGLVQEGTKCGNEMLCLSQECVSVSVLGLTPCPVGSNGVVCSGNGVCNNLDKCFCNVGFNGTDCSEPVNMAPRSSTDSTGAAIIGGVVGALVFIAMIVSMVIIIVVVYVYLSKSSGKTISHSPSRTRYTRPSAPVTSVHGSTDDLLMTAIRPESNSPSPTPPMNGGRSYQPYVPPPFAPSTTVSQNVRRPPPPPYSAVKQNQPTSSRPPPPHRQAPPPVPFTKPTPPVNKPAPPTQRPTPPANKPVPPSNKPGQSNKPVPTPRSNVQPKVPQTAPKPAKLPAWPPSESNTEPAPPKLKPIVPRKPY